MKNIVIGSGPAGRLASIELGKLGKEVTLIEKGHIAGTCLNEGCMVICALTDVTKFIESNNRFNHHGFIKSQVEVSYEKIIKSFAMSDHSIAKMEIGKVKKGKKSVVVNFSIGKTRFAIKKNYTDIVAEDYLEFRIDLIKVGVNILLNGVMMINFLIKHIILSDVDRDETKQLYLHPNYICLIESA